jgi:hypothetical protein
VSLKKIFYNIELTPSQRTHLHTPATRMKLFRPKGYEKQRIQKQKRALKKNIPSLSEVMMGRESKMPELDLSTVVSDEQLAFDRNHSERVENEQLAWEKLRFQLIEWLLNTLAIGRRVCVHKGCQSAATRLCNSCIHRPPLCDDHAKAHVDHNCTVVDRERHILLHDASEVLLITSNNRVHCELTNRRGMAIWSKRG